MSDIHAVNMVSTYRFDTFKYLDILQREVSYFLCVAETLNISKASEILGIRQSGLSRALQRLEFDLGQKLFQRKPTGLVLTKAGEQFLVAVKNTKSFWEENFKKILTESDTPVGIIKIGFHPSFGQKFFPQIVCHIAKIYPQVEIEAHTLNSALVTRKVNDGDLDLGLVISKVRNPELVQKKIGSDFLAAYQTNLNEVPQMVLVNPETQSSLPILRKYAGIKKVLIKDYDIMAQAAVAGNFLAVLPNSVAEKYVQLKKTGGTFLKADISCISHIEKLKSKANRKIFDLVIEACRTT